MDTGADEGDEAPAAGMMIRLIEAAAMIAVAVTSPMTGADTVRAEIVMRIDGTDARDVGFESIEAIELDPQGGVRAVDGAALMLHAFDARGKHRWTTGRKGRGPGEFESAVGLAWAPNGALWVIDPENQRATIVDANGRVSDTRPLRSSFTLSPWPGRFDRDGRLLHYAAPDDAAYDYSIAVLDSALQPIATRRPPAPPEPIAYYEGVMERGSHMRSAIPFTPRLVWRLDSRGRFVSAWTAGLAFSVDARPLGGAPVVTTSGPLVSAAERREAIAGLDRFVRMGGRVDASRIPARKPVLATFVLDDRDRIWAMMSPSAGDTSTRFEVYDPTGRHLRTVIVPTRLSTFPTIVVRGGRLAGVERDEDGTEWVVVARVP
jgi:hypothetical protein